MACNLPNNIKLLSSLIKIAHPYLSDDIFHNMQNDESPKYPDGAPLSLSTRILFHLNCFPILDFRYSLIPFKDTSFSVMDDLLLCW